MPNRLSQEKSPYLLQHADNPVDWYPWGEEAFRKAAEEDKPIFLSIGYATCHWCHVMAHESFEDEEVARLLNRHVISIKVDREERPDIDHIYMTVCQALTGSGGWPLSIFMTPDKRPFFAGTYFPKVGRMGMMGFTEIIAHVASLWENQRGRIFKVSEEITGAIQPKKSAASDQVLGLNSLEKAYHQLRRSFDTTWGGFGRAPKFPTPHHLTFLLRWHRRHPDSEALSIVEKTLNGMRDGGIFDHVGFGFHRYSVDERWLVPHFEKMLYDQSLLAMAYTEAYQVTGKERYARVVREIFEYVLRDMADAQGGFYSAEDADSEGKEGWFYVWTPKQVKAILGEERADVFCRVYDISPEGNFEEYKSIPHLARPIDALASQFGMSAQELGQRLEESRKVLFAAREQRIHPLKDDKVLTSWNGLMIVALAKGYQALREEVYLKAAREAADFILKTLHDDSGRLSRRYRHGEVIHPGYADDYAFLVWGLIDLYESCFDITYLEAAVRIQQKMFDLFWDEQEGAFFYTARDSESLIIRDKEIYDGAIPSSNSVAALNLLRLGRMTGNTQWEERADRVMKFFTGLVADYPSAYTQFLNALDFGLGPGQEIVIAGDPNSEETRAMIAAVQDRFMPSRVLILRGAEDDALKLMALSSFVEPLAAIDGKPTVYICENFACQTPVTNLEELKSRLRSS